MPWQARLSMRYQAQDLRTVLRHDHDGPLRILKSLYPEGDAICHNVIVHPPGGLVGGDELNIDIKVEAGAHALISTPGATRFYASDDAFASQSLTMHLSAHARLEWLPLETIAFPGCKADNSWSAKLEPGAEMMAWDVTALGLPGASQAFSDGVFRQRMEVPGLWLEKAQIAASDFRLLNSPLGLAGQRCMGTLVFAAGSSLARDRKERLLESVRLAIHPTVAGVHIGATCPNDHMLVIRGLAPQAEPLMHALKAAWAAIRETAWQLRGDAPRIWNV